MADAARVICESQALVDSGQGVRFEVEYFGEPAPAFVIRYRGTVHAYLNRKEGDVSNAGYWYARARRSPARSGLEQEWLEITRSLLAPRD